MKKDIYLIFIVTFAAYLMTAAPSIYWRDSPEFITTAFELGIAHPSGSPLYLGIANLFSYLPFAGVAFRVNILSGFFCSLVLVVFYFTLKELLDEFGFLIGDVAKRVIAVFAAMTLAFSESFWELSAKAEVYAMQNFFIILIIYLFVLLYRDGEKPMERNKVERLVYLIGFLFGLSSGAHIIMMLYFPAIAFCLFMFGGKVVRKAEVISVFLFLMILGGSIYIYLPVRSLANPFWDWGNTETFSSFWGHVTDKKDKSFHFSFSAPAFWAVLKNYLGFYWKDFSLSGIFLGFLGIIYTVLKERRVALLLVAIISAHWLFFIRYWYWSSQYVPSFMVFAVFIGIGTSFFLDSLWRFMKKTRPSASISWVASFLILCCLVQVASSAYLNGSEVDKGSYWAPREFFSRILEDVEDGSVILSKDSLFGLSYLAVVEGARPTVSMINIGDIFAPEYFNPLTALRYPLLYVPEDVDKAGIDLCFELWRKNAGRNFYWDPFKRLDHLILEKSIPNGYFYRLIEEPGPLEVQQQDVHNRRMISLARREYSGDDPAFADINELEFIVGKLMSQSYYFMEKKYFESARFHLQLAEDLLPDHGDKAKLMKAVYAELDERIAETTQ